MCSCLWRSVTMLRALPMVPMIKVMLVKTPDTMNLVNACMSERLSSACPHFEIISPVSYYFSWVDQVYFVSLSVL